MSTALHLVSILGDLVTLCGQDVAEVGSFASLCSYRNLGQLQNVCPRCGLIEAGLGPEGQPT
jgi:hypothetical protein